MTAHPFAEEGSPVVIPGHKGSRIALGPDGRVFVAHPQGGNISMSRDVSTPGTPLVDENPLGDTLPEELAMAADTTHLYFGMAGEVRRVRVEHSSALPCSGLPGQMGAEERSAYA